ncbi:MAG: hypothetical protein DRP51_08975 [Candidatus Zixiibacteriota bacterium]|nr:MAG: hypothetical protein DRP51_08975 [candidate division Zixibacteria bacterium]
MDTDQFLIELLKSVSGNTTVISELRQVISNLPVRAEFKNYENVCKETDITVSEIKKIVDDISIRLDTIDKWQKLKLPFIIGMITLILYAMGFFFTINKVADMIREKHPETTTITQPFSPPSR